MSKTKLLTEIQHLKQQKNITDQITSTIQSFEYYRTATNDELFSELCYCILTANCQAKTCMNIQDTFPHSFSHATTEQITTHLRNHHYRFPNIRSQFIKKAQIYKNDLKEHLEKNQGLQRRQWLTTHIKGLGMKESSHFLRNIGYPDYAIIDTHIISLLHNYEIIKKPKTITKKRYLHIEEKLNQIAKETNLTLATLDLYLWYMKTGWILK